MMRGQAIAALVASAALLAGCGGKKSAAPAPATTATTTAASTSAGGGGGCSSYGKTWVAAYNKTAIAQGNPVRMISACCRPTTKAGVHHCYLKVTLAGTKDLGCETVDIGPDGMPAGVGKHENCALHE